MISAIPVIISGIIVYQMVSGATINNSMKEYKKSLDQTVYIIDQYMVKIYSVIRLQAEDGDTTYYKKIDFRSKLNNEMLQFIQKLSVLGNYYEGVNSMYIYYYDKVISSELGFLTDERFDDNDWCRKIVGTAEKDSKYLVPYVSDVRKRPNSRGESKFEYQDVISIVSPVGGRNYENGMVVVNLNQSYFNNFLNKLKQSSSDQIFIVNKTTGSIISKSSSASPYINNLSSSDILKYINQARANSSNGIVDINGRKTVMQVSDSLVSEWTYIAFEDYKTITKQVEFVRDVTLYCIIILMFAGLIVSVVVVGKIYEPIKNMLADITNSPVKSQKDELAFINEYIHEIKSTSEYNKSVLNSNLPAIRESTLLNILRGRMLFEDDIRGRLKLCGIEFNNEHYAAVIVSIDMYSNFVDRYTLEERVNFKYYLLQVIEDKLKKSFCAYGVDTDQDSLCFITNIQSPEDILLLKKAFLAIKEGIYTNTDITFTVGIGKTGTTLSSLRDSYIEAVEALKERFNLGEDNIIYIGDLENKKESFYAHIKSEEELINSINAGNEARVAEIISNIIEDARSKELKSVKVKQILLEIVSFVGRYLFKSSITYDDIFQGESSILAHLEKCDNITQMEAYIINILISVSKYLTKTRNYDSDNEIIAKVKELINKKYMNDLSLTLVAETVSITPSYLSRIFYKETKYNFVEYINYVRINKAKELLLDSKVSIKDVTGKVGYTNYNTFSRVFKKQTGLSAKQYRLENGIKADEDE